MGSLSPDDIPGGSVCVLGANILIYAEQGVSQQASVSCDVSKNRT